MCFPVQFLVVANDLLQEYDEEERLTDENLALEVFEQSLPATQTKRNGTGSEDTPSGATYTSAAHFPRR